MAGKHLLVVEDERPIREMLAFTLSRAGFDVAAAADCRAAREAIADTRPDLILLDWMLPDLSGVEFSRGLKRDETTRDIPVIMLTARAEEEDKVRGLESGADDYVTKPFSSRELVARIKAVIRRATALDEDELMSVNNLTLDSASHRVTSDGKPIALGPTEFRLLKFLMSHPERAYSRGQLLDRAWGGNVHVEERTVDVHVRRLRKALTPFGCDHLIQTVRGTGYRFSTTGA